VFVLVFLPVGLFSRLFRRDLLASGVERPGSTWLERLGWSERRLPARSYASEQDLLGRRTGRLLWAVGLVTVVVAVDLAVGTVLVDPTDAPAPPPVAEGSGEASAIPALAGLDYVPQLFAEQFAAESGQYDALLGWRLEDSEGQYLNVVGEERVSATTGAAGDPVVVWFFGGSAMYGFGQRDDHTIPSELVRIAEADGVALEAHNFGTPAYVNWQGLDLFSQLLTERPAPDVAVFYDGYNDLSMQLVDGPVTQPSHVLARVQEQQLTAPAASVDPTTWRDLRDWAADHSAVTNLYRRVRDRFADDEPEVQLTEAEASEVPADVDVAATEAAAADLLARGRDLAAALGQAYDVDVQSWFQPTLYTKGPVEGEEHLRARAANRTPAWIPLIAALRAGFPPEVVDLADALDGHPDPLFWDTVHTNETGTRLVAEAAWPALREAVTADGGG
jgi:lysophospholipase L1-like esterase